MTRLLLPLIAAAFLAQDPAAAFGARLDKASKLGLVVPDLAKACDELDALAKAGGVPKDALDRLAVLRARADLLAPLHSRFLKAVGSTTEFPGPNGKVTKIKVLEVKRAGIRVEQFGGSQEILWGDLDAAWRIGAVRAEILKTRQDAAQILALAYADAGRWDLAFSELGSAVPVHPLAVEARKRGLDAIAAAAGAHVAASRWTEALAEAAKLPADDARVPALRQAVRDGLVAQGREAARRQDKKAMNAALDLLAKQFPDAAGDAKSIRDSIRWIAINDPAALGLTGPSGGPWKLEAKADGSSWYSLKAPAGVYDGFSVRIHPIGDGNAEADGGITFEGVQRAVWVYPVTASVSCAYVDRKDPKNPEWVRDFQKRADNADAYTLSVFVTGGEYIILCNGVELGRVKTAAKALEKLGVSASHGSVKIDQVWLRKKE